MIVARNANRPEATDSLYFVVSPKHKVIKIGRAVEPQARLAAMLVGSPDPSLSFLAVLDGQGCREGDWHKHWCHIHSHGEWFRDTPELRAAINAATLPGENRTHVRRSKRAIKYRKRPDRKTAFVEHNGKRYSLPGKYNSPESLQAYHRFLSRVVSGDAYPSRLTIPADEQMISLLREVRDELHAIRIALSK